MKQNIKTIKQLFIKQRGSWNVFAWSFLYALLPSVWLLVRVYVINNLASASFQTYVQWDYFNIFLEIIQQTMTFTLFWWFGKIDVKSDEHMNKVKEIYIFVSIVYAAILFILSFFVGDFVKSVGSDAAYRENTFFLLQLWSNYPAILSQISIIIFLNLKMYKSFAILLTFKVGVAILFDFTLSNTNVFSDPYIGIGLSTLLSESILFLASFVLVTKQFGFARFFKTRLLWGKLNFTKQYFSNVSASFIYSCINNLFYLFMITKNLNVSNNSAEYWLSNNIIWSWVLLLPNTIFSINKSVIAIDDDKSFGNQIKVFFEFQVLALGLLLVSFAIFIPTFHAFGMFLYNDAILVEKGWKIFSFVIWSFVLYCACECINSVFNAEGKNWTMVIQAIISNILNWVPFIILMALKKYTMDAHGVAIAWDWGQISSLGVNIVLISLYFYHSKKETKINHEEMVVE
jgi:Na+-driven multidrug efflux pump